MDIKKIVVVNNCNHLLIVPPFCLVLYSYLYTKTFQYSGRYREWHKRNRRDLVVHV